MHHQRYRRACGQCLARRNHDGLKVREGVYGLQTGIDSKRLFPTSRLLSSITGMPIPRNKAVVGENAFAHESASTSTAC